MKVSINWLKEFVGLNIPIDELIKLLDLHTIATKEVTDDFIELDMKGYNRADLLSLRGVAYEISAITSSRVKFTDEENFIWQDRDLPKIQVVVDRSDLCQVYCIAKIEGLKIGKSPKDLVKKLSDSGFRPVNNIADITNLVMLEYGQPLHAFDAYCVKDEKLIITTAREGEQLTTLDGKIRRLSGDLLITDSQKVLGLAGVIGGKDSEVSAGTTTILLEAAIFNPGLLRKTATKLGIQSEAAKRFYHGLTKKRLLQALDAAIRMYKDLGGYLTALTILGNTTDEIKKITLTQNKINLLIGVDIPPEQVESSLTKLGFKLASQGDALKGSPGWNVEVPYWRLDIEIEEDLVEEIARMYGYEEIPSAQLKGKLPKKIDQSLFNNIAAIKNKLIELGLTEVQTYSFYSTDVLRNTGKDKYLKYFIKIANPISSETEYLRCDLWPNLVEVVAKNIKHGFNDIAIFELSKVYLLNQDKSIAENYRLGISLVNGSDNPVAELNQIISQLSKELNLNISLGSSKQDQYAKDYFHPIRFSFLEKNDKIAGGIAEVHPRIVNRFGVDKRIAILECDIITQKADECLR